MKEFYTKLLTSIIFLALAGCGIFKLAASSLNDPPPNAPIVAQGTFVGQGGQTVIGSVTVYNVSDGSYVVRLSGLTAPVESSLVVQVVLGSGQVLEMSLRGSTGNQNYTVSVAAGSIFKQVKIHSNLNNIDYGIAALTSS